MSGYRVMAGVGSIPRNLDSEARDPTNPPVKPDDLPTGVTPLYCLQNYLKNRLGAGVTMSLSRTRNNNYIQEMGLREFTAATSGNYEVDFSFDGIFAPKLCEKWLGYAFMMGDNNSVADITLDEDSTYTFKKVSDGSTFTPSVPPTSEELATPVWVTITNDGTESAFGQPMLYADFKEYVDFVTHASGTKYAENTGTSIVKLFGYKNLTGPKYFDIGYQKINSHASGVAQYDGLDEIGVLVGCVIDSASISYESGSDAGVKFSISGHALRDIVQMVQRSTFDYATTLEAVPTEVFVGGCVSVFKTSAYSPIAQTDSASVSIANNMTKLGNCLRLNYSSYAMGALTYDVSTSTYSNDPNKYLKYLYGYATDLENGNTYYIAKQPIPIEHMKIRTDDTAAGRDGATLFMDINMTKTFVGDMSNSYSVDSAIMDEPSLRPQKVYIAVGYTDSSS